MGVSVDEGGFADALNTISVSSGDRMKVRLEGIPCAPRTTIFASREELMVGFEKRESGEGKFA